MNNLTFILVFYLTLAVLIVRDIQGKTAGYAATNTKISALILNQAETEAKLTRCNAAKKAESSSTDGARKEMNTSLNKTIQEIAKLQAEHEGQWEYELLLPETLRNVLPRKGMLYEALVSNH